ncbi:hypothetical protein UNDYM_4614 [Undibacterium sp. YM2]|uniref:hypothetical protein n=1 Tax=Undibacterium sp. YM2 TaxID=2058625 RepID=UPI001331E94E|nr:hypothetical protein [Undibacterium sp. YM2]BBB68867.1 hypothetical protein UNDYM_4614 [Undibacterium sp. YM2]
MKILRVSQWGVIIITLLALCSCTKRVTISMAGLSTTDKIPESGQVHEYPNLPEKDDGIGPYYVLYIESEDDIPKLASEFTHHLYFSLIPCSESESAYGLWGGGVFMDSGANSAASSVSGTGHSANRYKIHIPIKADPIIQHIQGIGALDFKSYLGRANKEDSCVLIGGGQMWGGTLFSNTVKTPLHFDSETGFSVVP